MDSRARDDETTVTTKPRVRLVTFATAGFRARRAVISMSARRYGGVTDLCVWSRARLRKTEFWRQHRDILNEPLGAGCWLWKPFIILDALRSVDEGDFVVYLDCGRDPWIVIGHRLDPLLDWCAAAGGVLPGIYVPQFGANRLWTKRDCFVLLGCDAARYWDHCQVQTNVSVWQKNQHALTIVRAWLDACSDPRVLVDGPNQCGKPDLAGFIEHRQDQSVMTLLALKHPLAALGNPKGPSVFGLWSKDVDFGLAEMGAARQRSIGLYLLKRAVAVPWFGRLTLRALKRIVLRIAGVRRAERPY